MKRLLNFTLVFMTAGLYGFSALSLESENVHNILIDTSKPLSVVWPFEVAVVGVMGEKGVRIGPKIGRGWRGEAGGEASYRFYIPEDGNYNLWAYCLWFDECANAVFAQIDDMDKAIVGNDPIYNQWHWVRGYSVNLKKGTHTLLLSNHSDHISLQKVFLANSTQQMPDNCGPVFSDIFYEGFDGCDQGNFKQWRVISGRWNVVSPEKQMCFVENALKANSEQSCLIIYQNDNWNNYSLTVAVMSEEIEGTMGICFGTKNPNQYHKLQWQNIAGTERARMQVVKKQDSNIEILTDFEVSWQKDTWHQIEILPNNEGIEIKIDQMETVLLALDYKIEGGIGLFSEGTTTAYFDDIHIRSISIAGDSESEGI